MNKFLLFYAHPNKLCLNDGAVIGRWIVKDTFFLLGGRIYGGWMWC